MQCTYTTFIKLSKQRKLQGQHVQPGLYVATDNVASFQQDGEHLPGNSNWANYSS